MFEAVPASNVVIRQTTT